MTEEKRVCCACDDPRLEVVRDGDDVKICIRVRCKEADGGSEPKEPRAGGASGGCCG